MEAQLHRHRQACSAHRRRVEGARLIVEIELGKLRFLDRQSRRPITRQSRVAGNGEHLYVGCAITSVAVFGGSVVLLRFDLAAGPRSWRIPFYAFPSAANSLKRRPANQIG